MYADPSQTGSWFQKGELLLNYKSQDKKNPMPAYKDSHRPQKQYANLMARVCESTMWTLTAGPTLHTRGELLSPLVSD